MPNKLFNNNTNYADKICQPFLLKNIQTITILISLIEWLSIISKMSVHGCKIIHTNWYIYRQYNRIIFKYALKTISWWLSCAVSAYCLTLYLEADIINSGRIESLFWASENVSQAHKNISQHSNVSVLSIDLRMESYKYKHSFAIPYCIKLGTMVWKENLNVLNRCLNQWCNYAIVWAYQQISFSQISK